ncbi:MAG: Fe2+-dependent dioxygenase [Burkholderiales bacterium]|nr:Fe2+-dependent dioxygenase [Burkholderiales bacterium]
MLLHIPDVLSKQEVLDIRRILDREKWTDGRATTGAQGAQAKLNRQLPVNNPAGRKAARRILDALEKHPLFISAALPLRTLEPMFNHYEGGGHYDLHVDGAVMRQAGTAQPLRSDISSTLFLSEPEDYDGGELIIADTYGTHEAKLPAGDLILYPSTSLHRVAPVTRGARICSFFWTQSMVRQDWQRTMLFELDQAIQKLRGRLGDDAEMIALTSHYHNLLRFWSEV